MFKPNFDTKTTKNLEKLLPMMKAKIFLAESFRS